jgi:hypothetical protein
MRAEGVLARGGDLDRMPLNWLTRLRDRLRRVDHEPVGREGDRGEVLPTPPARGAEVDEVKSLVVVIVSLPVESTVKKGWLGSAALLSRV